MKIRMGWVSNSSAASFMIPSFLLTDEQKEMLLSLDEWKDRKKQIKENLGISLMSSENDYARSDEYHRIFEQMVADKEWHDYDWEIGENNQQLISGAASMDNGSLRQFMEKIGIDVTAAEFVNHGHCSVHMATHPEAVAHFVKIHNEAVAEWDKRSEEDKQFDRVNGFAPEDPYPYEVDKSEFKQLGDSEFMQFEGNEYTYYYVVSEAKKNEDQNGMGQQ